MKAIGYIIFVIIICLLAYYFACFSYVHTTIFSDIKSLNPSDEAITTFATGIVSSIALACAFVAIYFQKQELEETRKELHDQKEELKNQNIILHKQQFEQTFNSLFVMYKQSLFSIQKHIENSLIHRHLYGVDYLASELKILNNNLSDYNNRDISADNQIRLFLNKLEPVFSQYFYLLSLVNNNTDINEKKKYYERLSDLSLIELIVIALFTIELAIPKEQAKLVKEEKILRKLLSIMDCNSLIKIPDNLDKVCKYILKFEFISLD